MINLKRVYPVLMIHLLFSAAWVFSVPDGPIAKISGTLDWESGKMETTVSFSTNDAGIRFPAGRGQAEDILSYEYPALLKSLLMTVQADSSSTIADLLTKGEFSHSDLDVICRTAQKSTPNFSADLARFSGQFSIALSRVRAAFIRHFQAGDPGRLLVPPPAANYTGIVIIANGFLPVHGRNTTDLVRPCLFPKIRDSQMNLVYERNLTDPAISGSGTNILVHYTSAEKIFRSTPSGIDASLFDLVGEHPLRIFATSVFGTVPTDPVINIDDARQILANENNRRLLTESRIVIVINETLLKKELIFP